MSMKEHDHTFIKVSLKGDPRIHYLKLPINMGGHESCDILLHSRQSVAPEFTLHMHEGKLLARSQKSGHPVDLHLFECMGILIDGPFFEIPSKKKDVPKSKSKKMRLLLLSTCLSLALLGIILGLKHNLRSATPDLSQVPIALREGRLHRRPFGYTPMFSGNRSAVHFQWSAKTPNVPYLFSFLAGSLDLNHEIVVTINSRIIYHYSLDINCVENFCPIEIMIPMDSLHKEINLLSVLHRQKESFYIIKDVVLTPIPPVSDDELAEIHRKNKLAHRYFEDRHISSINLVSAHSQIARALELVGKRQVPKDLKIEITGLAKDIEGQLQQMVQKLEDEMTNQIKLQLHYEAIKNAEQLVKLYRESDYIKRGRVIALMEQLKSKKI